MHNSLSTSLKLYFYKFGKVCTVATRKYCKPKDLLACFRSFKINNSQNIIPFNKKFVFCHMSIFQNVTVNNYAILKFFTTTAILEGNWVLETPYLLLQVLLLQMFSSGNWLRKSLFSGNNEQVILAQIC